MGTLSPFFVLIIIRYYIILRKLNKEIKTTLVVILKIKKE